MKKNKLKNKVDPNKIIQKIEENFKGILSKPSIKFSSVTYRHESMKYINVSWVKERDPTIRVSRSYDCWVSFINPTSYVYAQHIPYKFYVFNEFGGVSLTLRNANSI